MAYDIYIASSWRNKIFDEFYKGLLNNGFNPYNFKAGEKAFNWRETLDTYKQDDLVSAHEMTRMLNTIQADEAYQADMSALEQAQVCLLLLPCGKSAHFELGWAVAKKKDCIVFMSRPSEPELMYKECHIVNNFYDLLLCLRSITGKKSP